MITVAPIAPSVLKQAKKHGIERKFLKQCNLLSNDPKHPSLHVELMHPASDKIYSFRIDRKFRALFIWNPNRSRIDILYITAHYQ